MRRAIRKAERLYRIPASPISSRKAKNKGRLVPPSKFDYGHREAGYGCAAALQHRHQAARSGTHAIMVALMGWTPKGIEDHDPQWLGVYLYLLADAGLAPMVALKRQPAMPDCGGHPRQVGPKKIRKALPRTDKAPGKKRCSIS